MLTGILQLTCKKDFFQRQQEDDGLFPDLFKLYIKVTNTPLYKETMSKKVAIVCAW